MQESNYKIYLIKLGLFLLTIVTTTLSGAELIYGRSFVVGPTLGWNEFMGGFEYSIPFLLFLTCHEFGHYFTAKHYNIKVTLPSYLPMWLGFIMPFNIGTMGAFIRIRSFIKTKQQHFDIGIAGPIAGFAVALGLLFYGYTHLPEPDHVFEIHPEFESFGAHYADTVYDMDTVLYKKDYASTERYNYAASGDSILYSSEFPSIQIGKNLLILAFEEYVVSDKSKIPNGYEFMHYPWLFAGFLALLFTALNLLPIGQLDGGHVLYGLFGSKIHGYISQAAFIAFVLYAGLGVISPFMPTEDLLLHGAIYVGFLYLAFQGLKKDKQTTLVIALAVFVVQLGTVALFPNISGYSGWMLFAIIIGRFLGVYHPKAPDESPLDTNRKILGWVCLLIFILCFSPQPIIIQ